MLFQNSRSNKINLLILRHVNDGRVLHINQEITRTVIFKKNGLTMFLRNSRYARKVLVCFCNRNNGIGINVHIHTLFHPYYTHKVGKKQPIIKWFLHSFVLAAAYFPTQRGYVELSMQIIKYYPRIVNLISLEFPFRRTAFPAHPTTTK